MIRKKKNKYPGAPYLPKALKLIIDEKKYEEGYKALIDAARTYFNRFQQALNPFPTDDTALLICLYRHMADGLEKSDEKAAAIAKLLQEHVKLPPIEFDRRPK